MAREYGNQADVLERFRDRIRDRAAGAHQDNVFITLGDFPAPEDYLPQGELFYTISYGDSNFNDSMYAGSGQEQLLDEGEVGVSIWHRTTLDEISREAVILVSEDYGLYRKYKPSILAAIVLGSWDAEVGTDKLLRELPQPVRSTAVAHMQVGDGHTWAMLTVFWNVKFDWYVGQA